MSDYPKPLSTLTIDLDAVAWNWLSLKKMLKAGADCAAVVKADAYGLGASKVALALYAQGCRHFFVAHFSEALDVRGVLAPDACIYLLNGPYGAKPDDFAQHGFIPVLNSMGDMDYWQDTGLPCVLHLDTGMNRLGLGADDAVDDAVLKKLDLRYVMSHLACADEPAHELNALQLQRFQKRIAALGKACRYSFANSSGIFLGQDYHFDLARPGCALYGINPVPHLKNPMKNPVKLEATIVQVRDGKAGETVGYGAGYKIALPTKCATVSLGYADGYLRSLTGKGVVFIQGKACPVIGRVSMDSIVADVTHLEHVPTGTYAEIIGDNQSADDVAAQAGTIGYEILTSLGARYKRKYLGS